MKKNKPMSLMMALLLSITLYSCGGDSTTDDDGSATNYTNTITGAPTNDINLSAIENFQRNVAEGRFKAPLNTNSRYNYFKGIASTSSSSTTHFYCNILFICDSGELKGIDTADIMTRTINQTNGLIIRQAADTGLSTAPATLKNELTAKIQAARNRSNSYNIFFEQVRTNAFIMKPGDNFEYVIDLDKPLAANPVFRRNLGTSEVYDFLEEYSF